VNRVAAGGYSELIEAAYRLVPRRLHDLIRPHFLTGVDPVFAGLHGYQRASYGRSYRSIPHVAYGWHQRLLAAQRHTTVVLPSLARVSIVVHELGHVLHERLGFEPEPEPVTWYGQTDTGEAFAEAFAAWALPFGHGYGAAKDQLYERDRPTVALFDGLAR
jgi:hypothetical protein